MWEERERKEERDEWVSDDMMETTFYMRLNVSFLHICICYCLFSTLLGCFLFIIFDFFGAITIIYAVLYT